MSFNIGAAAPARHRAFAAATFVTIMAAVGGFAVSAHAGVMMGGHTDDGGAKTTPAPAAAPAPKAAAADDAKTPPLKLRFTVVECLSTTEKDDIPAALQKLDPALKETTRADKNHTACGRLPSRIRLSQTVSLSLGKEATASDLRQVPFVDSAFVVSDKGGVYVSAQTQKNHMLKAGTALRLTLGRDAQGHMRLRAYVDAFDVEDANNQELLMTGDNKVYLNPRPQQQERVLLVDAALEQTDKPQILSGQAYMRTALPAKVPDVFPEQGRLWLEVITPDVTPPAAMPETDPKTDRKAAAKTPAKPTKKDIKSVKAATHGSAVQKTSKK